MKIIVIFLAALISSCSLFFRGDGGISLVGELEGIDSRREDFEIIEGCVYDVLSSKGRIIYSRMELVRFGSEISINLSVEPKKEDYTVKIYCHGKLIKEIMTNSSDKEPTNIGTISVAQT